MYSDQRKLRHHVKDAKQRGKASFGVAAPVDDWVAACFEFAWGLCEEPVPGHSLC